MEKLVVPGAKKFLHLDDSQNVPLAVGLLKLIAELAEHDRSTLTPFEQQGMICEAILSPFSLLVNLILLHLPRKDTRCVVQMVLGLV